MGATTKAVQGELGSCPDGQNRNDEIVMLDFGFVKDQVGALNGIVETKPRVELNEIDVICVAGKIYTSEHGAKGKHEEVNIEGDHGARETEKGGAVSEGRRAVIGSGRRGRDQRKRIVGMDIGFDMNKMYLLMESVGKEPRVGKGTNRFVGTMFKGEKPTAGDPKSLPCIESNGVELEVKEGKSKVVVSDENGTWEVSDVGIDIATKYFGIGGKTWMGS